MRYQSLRSKAKKHSRSGLVILGLGGVLALIVFVIAPVSKTQSQEDKHNVIVLMTDDLNMQLFNDAVRVGIMPSFKKYFVDEGMGFKNNFVTTSECCPSRGTFFTGQYVHNHGMLAVVGPTDAKQGINWWRTMTTSPEEKDLPVWLHDGGYRTGLIGKYLNGYGTTTPTYTPPGFDDWRVFINADEEDGGDTYTLYENGELNRYDSVNEYDNDILAQKAVDFVKNYENDVRPFFLELAPKTPHLQSRTKIDGRPFTKTREPAPRHRYLATQFKDIFNASPSFNEKDVTDKPFYIGTSLFPRLNATDVHDLKEIQYPNQLASLASVDDMIKSVMEELERQGLSDSTYVLFTSDNGFFYGEHRLTNKKLAYEESIRLPLYVRGPGISPATISDKLVINTDLAPTIAEIAGVEPQLAVDGRSMMPLFQDPNNPAWTRKTALIERWQIRTPRTGSNPPTFAALRSIDPVNNTNNLYMEWFNYYVTGKALNNSSLNDPAAAHEFYNLDKDPYQLDAKQLSTTRTNALHDQIVKLRTCGGTGIKKCSIFEDQ